MARKELEGPFQHHVFIGCSPADQKTVKTLRGLLENSGVSCCFRDDFESDNMKSIKRKVMGSQKCMIILTPDYIKDDWFNIETGEMKNKAAHFCPNILLILKEDTIETPERLKDYGYKEFVFQPDMMNDVNYIAFLVEEITRETNLQLSRLSQENIGYGAACGYFFGYLNLVLPDFKKRLVNETFMNEPDELSKCVKKMLIIIPESCFCPPSLEMEKKTEEKKETEENKEEKPGEKTEKLIEFTGKYVVRVGNRAGNNNRDYKSSVFKLFDRRDSQKLKEYYFVGELATPLLTMHEMYSNDLCGMTLEQLYLERNAFYSTLKSILSHEKNASLKNQFKILYWSDPSEEKRNHLTLHDFLLPVLENELALESRYSGEDERNALKHTAAVSTAAVSSASSPLKSAFDPVKVPGANMARIYERVSSYPMDSKPRGKCLIVNIMNFVEGNAHVDKREGAEKDSEALMKLFKEFHFEVHLHNDVDLKTLEHLLLTMNVCDHSKYDAFVCCILTHGNLGVVYTSDGKPVEILEIVDFFSDEKCPLLKGKPKLFFIQACQGVLVSDPTANQMLTITNSSCEPVFGHESHDANPELGTLNEGHLKHKAVLVPGAPDILMSYSTLPGSLSYRNPLTGSLYIQALVKRLKEGNEIDRALKLVSGDVGKMKKTGFQLPFHLTSGMDRLVYLNGDVEKLECRSAEEAMPSQ